jgi:hypothetical protein
MKHLSIVGGALLMIGCGVVWQAQNASGQGQTSGSGFVALFDGKSLNGWSPLGDANWRIEDGAIVADKASKISYLVSKDTWSNFQIKAEFWVDADANSGVFIRCTDPKDVSSKTAYEVNIFDKRPDPSFGTGAIVGVAKAATVLKAADKWNTYEIEAADQKFTVTLNGTKTVDGASDGKFPAGHVALQYGSGVVKFRKVEIKKL